MKQQFRAAGIWPFKLTPQECNNRICSNIFQIVLLLCEQEVAMILGTSIFGINKLICLSTIFKLIALRMLTSSYPPFKCSDLDFDVSTWSRKKPDNSFAEKQLSVVFVLDCYLQCFSYLIIVIFFYTDTIFVRIKFTPKNADFSR